MVTSNTSLYYEAKDTVDDDQGRLETTESAKTFIEVLLKKTVPHMLASIFEGSMDRVKATGGHCRQDSSL